MRDDKDNDDERSATAVATGATPPRNFNLLHATDEYDYLSRAIVPRAWSENEWFQASTRFFGAGLASMVSAVVTNPVDIIKVRQQLDTRSSNSVLSVARLMSRTEGFSSLMIGTSASVAREASYSLIRLGTYEMFKDSLKRHTGNFYNPDGLPLKLTASIIAGTIGSAVANPTDLVKIRMQAYHPSGTPYRSMRHAFSTVYHEGRTPSTSSPRIHGLTNLYRGVFPTVARGWTVAACQMPAYDHTKQLLKENELLQEGIGAHLAASLFAGLVVSLASNPVDVIKVRIMSDTANRYRGVLHCAADVMRYEGPLAFYKGFGMCWARLGTHTVVTYMIYEQLRLLAGVKPL